MGVVQSSSGTLWDTVTWQVNCSVTVVLYRYCIYCKFKQFCPPTNETVVNSTFSMLPPRRAEFLVHEKPFQRHFAHEKAYHTVECGCAQTQFVCDF
jgi:hypothetical protein